METTVVLLPVQGSLESHLVTWNDCESSERFQDDIRNILLQQDFLETPLLRRQGYDVAGLYAYHNVPDCKQGQENIRATRLAMACGLISLRFYGPVLLVRSFGGRWEPLDVDEIVGACSWSPDLRVSIQTMVAQKSTSAAANVPQSTATVPLPPPWLENAAQENYHDGAELQKVIAAMNPRDLSEGEEEDTDDDSDASLIDEMDTPTTAAPTSSSPLGNTDSEFTAKSPLCLHCRRSCSQLCPSCHGAYFCTDKRNCRKDGWSHECSCATWKIYCDHRVDLSDFGEFFGDWQRELISRPHQLGEEPYEQFLLSIGIHPDHGYTWWRTEFGGWAGGQSSSASQVDASIRRTYEEGFAPINDIPPERRVTDEDVSQASLKRNSLGLLVLSSWRDYYNLRRISPNSCISLLCTFPLTIYYAIEQFGQVPVTVARMMKRPLRIHVVGTEKEMNILDLFQEIMCLLPEDLKLELVFVVREDMLPSTCQTANTNGKYSMKVEYESMVIGAVSGTYGTDDLSPDFDCGTGPPDMVMALNAGLFAYESWRSVVSYLYTHTGVVGVFSDYNEYSGVNCASLGGSKSRNSLRMNPFRQPRAMPVYSMNLPQYSNGFLYTFNEQDLE